MTKKYLSEKFLATYKDSDPFKTELGKFVFYRTYSRALPELGRREYWWEVVKRCVEYNCNLDPNITIEEMELCFDYIYNMKFFPSGRTLWVGGTPVAEKFPLANYNCCHMTMDDIEKFNELFYLLMLGCGVGLSVESKYVSKLPTVLSKNVKLVHKEYDNKSDRKIDFTSVSFHNNGTKMILEIGDSKEAWQTALKLYFDTMFTNHFVEVIEIDYDFIRPKGSPLKTFGGTASGHGAMEKMFSKIHATLNGKTRLKPIDVLDIVTSIAENVVSGGVRRSSEIILCDPDDKEVIEAKSKLYTQNDDGDWEVNQSLIHRQYSNNSIMYYERPTREQLHDNFQKIRYSGEPAFINVAELQRRKPDGTGVNPCAEILLVDRQCCNLVEIITVNCDHYDELLEVATLAARWSYRMASIELELPTWNAVNVKERLVGVSLTGQQDWINKYGLTPLDVEGIMINLREQVHVTIEDYSKELGLECPDCMTTVKPSGTLSQLPTVSSGLHFSHSPYYIRRVRISTSDPLFKAMEMCGFNWQPEVGQERDSATVAVFEFPVKAPNGKTKDDVSAIEQLEYYKMLMENYVDHNASNTVHVRDNEWDAVEEWVYNNWDCVVGITFLSYDDNFYQLLPYEKITKEQYEEMLSKTPKFNPETLVFFEDFKEYEVLDSECAGGACPVR